MGSASSSSAKGMEAAAKLQNTKVVVSPGSADESAQMPANRPHAEATTKPTADIGISSPAPPASPMPPRARPKASIPGQKDGAAGTPDATEGQAAEVQAVDKAELARRKKLQEQEDASLAQMSAAQYQAFEKRMEVKKKKMGTSFEADPAKKQHDSPTKTGRSSSAEGPEDTRRKKLQEQEEASIEQQMAQQYRAFEAQQHGGGGAAPGGHAAGPDEEKARRRKLEEQEASIEQQMAQQYRAFEAQQGGGHGKSGGKPTKEEQEELSIDMMNLAQYKAFEAQMIEKERKDEADRALKEADAMMDQFAPPSKTAPKKKHVTAAAKPPKGQKPKLENFSPMSGMAEDRDEISEIIEGKIYLTNYRGAERLEELRDKNIKHIVCVNSQDNAYPDHFTYFNIDNLEDQEDHNATEHFATVKQFTDKALLSGGGVCFHCAAGISRSATMVIAYLMASERMTLLEAFATCYHHRRVTWPNRSFMKQLISYEAQINKKKGRASAKSTITIQQWDKWTAGEQG